MTRLWFVRHGPTYIKAMVGWSDPPAVLDDLPVIRRLTAALPDHAPLVSSDLLRAGQTADAICGDRTRFPDDAGLREIHFGDWEMKGFAEVEADDPSRIRAFWERPGNISPPNGESWNQTSARVSRAVDRYIGAGHADIVLVCHFGAILTQIQRATGQTAYDTFAQPIDNLSVTQIDVTDEGWALRFANLLL